MVAVSVEAFPEFDPSPRVGITITDLTVGASVVSVWRIADGERNPVRGARRADMSDSDYVIDYDVPLGRKVSYEVEVVSGPQRLSRVTSSSVTVNAATGCIMDPLIPESAVPVIGGKGDDVYLRSSALSELEYQADVQVYNIMGSSKPLALFGQRMAERGLDTSMSTRSAEQNARLEGLLKSTAQLLFRPLPGWGTRTLPGTMFLANATATQLPVDVSWGGNLTRWDLKSDVVAAPTIKVLTATFTYGDVSILFETYGQKQDLMLGKTYLDDLKNPIGG
jgi:hypothetical protein